MQRGCGGLSGADREKGSGGRVGLGPVAGGREQ